MELKGGVAWTFFIGIEDAGALNSRLYGHLILTRAVYRARNCFYPSGHLSENKHLIDNNIDPENTQTDVTVNIPEESKAKLSDSTGKFGIKAAGKKAWFSVRIKSISGDNLKGVPFYFRCIRNKVLTRDVLGRSGKKELVPDGYSKKGGVITCEVPFKTKNGELIIQPYGDKEDSRSLHYFIEFAANGPEGSDTGDRFRTANGGLSSINPLKKSPLSETARNLFENPGQLMFYVPRIKSGMTQRRLFTNSS